MKRKPFATAVAGLALIMVAACSGGSDDTSDQAGPGEIAAEGPGISLSEAGGQALSRNDPVDGGSLTVGMQAPVETLDPLAQLGAPGQEVARLVHGSLMTYDKNGIVVPELAESLTSDDDGDEWTMVLRDGVKFSDGTPFDAAAVVSHLDRIKATVGSSSTARIKSITSYEVTGDKTIDFVLPAADFNFPTAFAPTGAEFAAAYVASPTAVEKLGAKYGQSPVGAGPFMVESFKPGGDIKLVKNPNFYVADLPHLDALKYVTATDSQARLSAVIAGDIDVAVSQSAADFEKAEKGGLTVLRQPSPSYFNVLFNLGKAPFDDIRFRKAVIQGIDLKKLNQAVANGLQPIMTGIFPPDHPFYKDTGWPSFDAAAAKELVEEYTSEAGNKAEFTLTTTSPPEYQQQAQVMQQMLSDVGITVKIVVGDQPTMITEALAGTFDAQLRYTGLSAATLNQLSNAFGSKSPGNISRAGNSELDALMAEATITAPDKRADLFGQMQDVLTQWLPYMPVLQHSLGVFVTDKVGGFPGTYPGTGTGQFDASKLWIAK